MNGISREDHAKWAEMVKEVSDAGGALVATAAEEVVWVGSGLGTIYEVFDLRGNRLVYGASRTSPSALQLLQDLLTYPGFGDLRWLAIRLARISFSGPGLVAWEGTEVTWYRITSRVERATQYASSSTSVGVFTVSAVVATIEGLELPPPFLWIPDSSLRIDFERPKA